MHLFVGDTVEGTAQAALAVSSDAYLITLENWQDIHPGVVHASLGDLNDLEIFFTLLKRADKITTVYPHVWSDGLGVDDMYSTAWYTAHYVKIAQAQNVFVPTPANDNPPCIWLAGCSTTAGEGLASPQKRYGCLVAQQLNLELVDMSRSGSSIQWSAERILHSDVTAGDIVIWGLTNMSRFPYYYKKRLHHININNYNRHKKWLQNYITIEEFDSENLYYHNLQSIRSVENFCKKIGATLVKVSIHCGLDISAGCADDDFIFIHGSKGIEHKSSYLDDADDPNDKSHPGPLTHQMYAQRILQHLEKVND